MDKKSRAIRCVAFLYDAELAECDYRPPPSMECAASPLKEVFDGQCPFIFSFNNRATGYCVVCSSEPDAAEIMMIKAAVKKQKFQVKGRTQVFVVGSNPES